MPRMTISKSSIVMCKDPEWFGTSYFLSIGIVKEEGEGLVFCEDEQSEERSETKLNERDSDPQEATEVETHFEKSLPTEAEQKSPEVKSCSIEENQKAQKGNGRG